MSAANMSTHRRWAMERLGHDITDLDTWPYLSSGGPLLSAIRQRTLGGWAVHRLNHDLLDAMSRHQPDLVWLDKAIFIRARTIKTLREAGAFTLHYNGDNPFGPRKDPGWRCFLEALPEYDLHLVPRESNLDQYRKAGARDVKLLPFAYEPTLHFPPPANWSDKDRKHDVTFIGTPYDKRGEFLTALWEKHDIRTAVWGAALWKAALSPRALDALWQGEARYNDAYRETIWRSRICLSFVTHSNDDDSAVRSFEIAACGGFMLVEDTPGHRAVFSDGKEAVFFQSVADCARKIAHYLPDQAARTRIAKAARERCLASGYGNDARLQKVFAYLDRRRTN